MNMKHGPVTREKNDNISYQINLERDKSFVTLLFTTQADASEWIEAIKMTLEHTSPSLVGISVRDSSLKTNQMVPYIVYYFISILMSKISQEGIFRLPGNQLQISSIKSCYLDGEIPALEEFDETVIASLLKVYFRELKQPIIPADMISSFFATNSLENDAAIKQLSILVSQLDEYSRITLCFFLRFLLRVSKKSEQNKMDVQNLSLAISPSIFHAPSDADQILTTTCAGHVFERMILFSKKLFQKDDISKATALPLGPFLAQFPIDRPEYTSNEGNLILLITSQHREDVSSLHFFRMLKLKNRQFEEVVICVGDKRIYFFQRGGKLELDIHYLDLLQVISLSSSFITITYGTNSYNHGSSSVSIEQTASVAGTNSGANQSEIRLRPISFVSWDIDLLICSIYEHYRKNIVFTHPPVTSFVISSLRFKRIQSVAKDDYLNESCGGYNSTYRAYTDYLGILPNEDLIYNIDFLYKTKCKTFDLTDCYLRDKYPIEDFKCAFGTLNFNTWFDKLIIENIKLSTDHINVIASLFRTNSTIKTLSLSNLGASSSSMYALPDAFACNAELMLEHLDISNNSIDDRTAERFAASFDMFNYLVYLNLSSCGISKKAMPILLEALQKNAKICAGLRCFDLSRNALDSVEASRQLGLFLGKSTSLVELKLANTLPILSNTLAAFETTGLLHLDISEMKSNLAKSNETFIGDFLKRCSNIQSLSISNSSCSLLQLFDILDAIRLTITSLDISDNEMSDEMITQLIQYITSYDHSLPLLVELNMNGIFVKRTRDRTSAINAIISLIKTSKISTLRIRGSRCALKGEILPLVQSLLESNAVSTLDISGHQCGDALANILSKVVQINRSLKCLVWNENAITISGYRAFYVGLKRNTTIINMPLPIYDLFSILKTANESDSTTLSQLALNMQLHILSNATYEPYPILDSRGETNNNKASQSGAVNSTIDDLMLTRNYTQPELLRLDSQFDSQMSLKVAQNNVSQSGESSGNGNLRPTFLGSPQGTLNVLKSTVAPGNSSSTRGSLLGVSSSDSLVDTDIPSYGLSHPPANVESSA